MEAISLVSDFASLGAAGVMGALWLWERKLSRLREQQLSEAHGRIIRDEERLGKLTQVVEHNTAAITRFHETQHEACETLKHILKELNHGHWH